MRPISYRAKQRLRKGLRLFLIGIAACLLLLVLVVIYLGRFLVYTPEGVYLDFGRNTAKEVASEPAPVTDPILVNEQDIQLDITDANANTATVEKISGYYIDLEMLNDPDAVLSALQEISPPCTVMIDLKRGDGAFYYNTDIEGAVLANVDIDTVEAIIAYLKSHGFTMIARVRTFQDSAFALEHLSCGLAISGGALWVGDGTYWLDPANPTVVSYLKQIARELAGKGFKEIVFDDFYFPSSNQIIYSSELSRTDLMTSTARDLLNFFGSSNITISFGNPASDFDFQGSSHVFISDITGSGVNTVLQNFAHLDDPEAQIVFLTGSKDNRFADYQVLRPLLSTLVS